MRLSDQQIRVLGCLLEKQRTTPDVYPLSLNSLRLACNQSTNRDPVVTYDDAVIREALRGLERRGLARMASGAGSRAPKYRHLLDEALPLAGDERAIICTLMLRGAQTAGELKQRGERMHPFADLASVQHVLDGLIQRRLVARLRRRPGQKEERYAHLLREERDEDAGAPQDGARAPAGEDEQPRAGVDAQPPAGLDEQPRAGVDRLEQRVAQLERAVAELQAQLQAAPGANRISTERAREGREA